MVDPKQLAVWWTTRQDCEAIGEKLDDYVPDTPAYLVSEYTSRLTRSGPSRLSKHPQFGSVKADFRDNTIVFTHDSFYVKPLVKELAAANATGIVIWARHAPLLASLPGVLTTLSLNRLDSEAVARSLLETALDGCTCREIQAADHLRHFRECPLRKPLPPDHPQAGQPTPFELAGQEWARVSKTSRDDVDHRLQKIWRDFPNDDERRRNAEHAAQIVQHLLLMLECSV